MQQFISPKFQCQICAYNPSKKSSLDKHMLTAKHILLTQLHCNAPKSCYDHKCIKCTKMYKSRVGLWYHKKKCVSNKCLEEEQEEEVEEVEEELISASDNIMVKEIIKQNQHLILENQEFKKLLMDLACKPTTTTIKQVNSHNKQFNLNVYLNETCKDAMNLSEFVDSLVIKASELEDMGRLGYAQGISNIIIRGLNELDETQRPFHCTDKKREIIYIKENNVWEKETMGRLFLRKMIRDIAHRNFKRMPQWMLDNPSCDDISTKKHTEYMSIVNQVMTGLGPEDDIGINKIIRNVANYSYIDKCGIMMGF